VTGARSLQILTPRPFPGPNHFGASVRNSSFESSAQLKTAAAASPADLKRAGTSAASGDRSRQGGPEAFGVGLLSVACEIFAG